MSELLMGRSSCRYQSLVPLARPGPFQGARSLLLKGDWGWGLGGGGSKVYQLGILKWEGAERQLTTPQLNC